MLTRISTADGRVNLQLQNLSAARAETILPNGGIILPAAQALVADGVGGADAETLNQTLDTAFTLDQLDMGDDEQVGQLIHRDGVQEVVDLLAAVQRQTGLQCRADNLIGTGLLQIAMMRSHLAVKASSAAGLASGICSKTT